MPVLRSSVPTIAAKRLLTDKNDFGQVDLRFDRKVHALLARDVSQLLEDAR